MSLSEQDVRRIIRDEIRRAFGFDTSAEIEFLPTEQAYKKLGYLSYQELTKAVYNGTLRIGIEVQDRRSPDSSTARYYFNINACLKRLNTPPEKRAN